MRRREFMTVHHLIEDAFARALDRSATVCANFRFPPNTQLIPTDVLCGSFGANLAV